MNQPPRPQPSEPFLRSSFRIDWPIVFAFCITGLLGGALFGAIFSEVERHDNFVKNSEVARICADGTRIYKMANGEYCSWLCRQHFPSPEICR